MLMASLVQGEHFGAKSKTDERGCTGYPKFVIITPAGVENRKQMSLEFHLPKFPNENCTTQADHKQSSHRSAYAYPVDLNGTQCRHKYQDFRESFLTMFRRLN